jgi:hypothetical protein
MVKLTKKKAYIQELGKYRTEWTILNFIIITKYEIMRPYPATKYIVDKWWRIGFVRRV